MDLFKELQKMWKNTSDDPKKIIETLESYVDEYLALVGKQFPQYFDKQIVLRLERLYHAKAPSSTYPFLMKLLKEYSLGNVDVKTTGDILDSIESFLVRRAICGIEPTGLLVMFRTLWNNIKENPSQQKIHETIKKRTTIDWPNDERFKNAILNRGIYQSNITGYVILEYEKSLNADFPDNLAPWIEHVLPQTMNDDWKLLFSREDHDKLVHTWGNLIPLSSKMNQELSQSKFEIKRETIAKDSMYASARRLGESYVFWTPNSISQRGHLIAEWALERWQHDVAK